ncbi:MAG: hypothetical protein QM594_16270 [Niabella sp.]
MRIFFLIVWGMIVLPGCKKDNPEPDSCKNCPVVYKPNIYIYPLKETRLSVGLSFPLGGSVIASIPEYNTGWNVNVAPSGKIDGKYDYLFYESRQPDKWQKKTGWVVKRDSLEHFFEADMETYQFKPNEMKDFIDYWIPRLNDAPYYAIYPQEKPVIEKLIQLHFSEQPDNVLRLFYVVKALDKPVQLKPHNKTTPVSREGFNVAEWGVILE